MTGKLPFFQSAAIYGIADKVIINPYERTSEGIRVAMSEVGVANSSDPMEVGSQLLALLEKCRDGVAFDHKVKSHPAAELLTKETGIKSTAVLQKRARTVMAYRSLRSSVVELEPHRHEGRYSVAVKQKKRIGSTDPLSLGQAVIESLADAE